MREVKLKQTKFVIYPTAKICKTIKHGQEGDICDFVFATSNLVIGERVHIAAGVKLVGKGTVYIGDDSTIAPNCVIYTSVPDMGTGRYGNYDNKMRLKIADVHIGKNVFIGAGSVIAQGVKIKDCIVIPALSYIGEGKTINKSPKMRKVQSQ